jgi:hypothetical protein
MKLAYCGLGECQYPEKLAKLNEIHDKIIVAVFGARNAICFRDGVKTSSIKLIISLHQDLYYQGFSIGYRIPESLFCEADLKGTMMGYPVVFHRTIDHFALPELNIPEIIVTEVLS